MNYTHEIEVVKEFTERYVAKIKIETNQPMSVDKLIEEATIKARDLEYDEWEREGQYLTFYAK